MAGEYRVDSRLWLAPEQPPLESPATARIRSIFAGRYRVQEYESTFMGRPFRGMGIDAYNNVKKKYLSLWIDSMSSGFMLMEGTRDPDTGVLTMRGEETDPFSGETHKTRSVAETREDGTIAMSMYREVPGAPEPFKVMELIYHPKKKSHGKKKG